MPKKNRFFELLNIKREKFCHRNIPCWPLRGKNRAQRARIRGGMMAMG